MNEQELAAIEARWDAAAVRLLSTVEMGQLASTKGLSDIWRLVAEVRRLRAVADAGRALFRLKDTGSSDDLYRAWRELGAQLAFAEGKIPLGSDADLRRSEHR